MANIVHKFDLGRPGTSIGKWPKDTVIETQVVKTVSGRFIAMLRVNGGEFFSLPSTHPTQADAELTLKVYIADNLQT